MSPEHILEAQRLVVAFQIALARLGAAAILEAIALFNRLNANRMSQTAQGWLDSALDMIASRRGPAQQLAIAYYRLARALETGTTLPTLEGTDEESVTLNDLRADFYELAADAGTPEVPADSSDMDRIDWTFLGDDDAEIPVEQDIDPEELRAFLEDIDEDAIEEAARALVALGPDNITALTAKDVEPEEAHERSAMRQAASADRIVKNAGRATVFHLIDQDRRAMGYVRMSTTGTPCYWCAMLISRGFVYKDADTAQYSEGDLYHDNCRCVAVPVYRQDQYRTADVFEQNRELQTLWNRNIRGKFSGKEALREWRRLLKRRGMETATDEVAA